MRKKGERGRSGWERGIKRGRGRELAIEACNSFEVQSSLLKWDHTITINFPDL